MLIAGALGAQEVIPWPISLGIAGMSIGTTLALLVWLVKQIAGGRWQDKVLVDSRMKRVEAEADKRVAAAEANADARILEAKNAAERQLVEINAHASERLALEKRRGDEWKETALVERAGRQEQTEVARLAVESNRIVDHFFSSYLPPHPGSPQVPQIEDNGHKAERSEDQ